MRAETDGPDRHWSGLFLRSGVILGILGLLSLISMSIGVAEFDSTIALISRFPRTAACLLTGASMAISGVVMQLLVRNRFVEPGTTGTTEAAMLGLLAATLLTPGMALLGKMAWASVAALAGMGGFLLLVRNLPPDQPLLIPLVGLIYSGILGAGATFIAYQTDLIQYLGIWLTGEFSGVLAGRYELLWLAGAAAALTYFAADQLTVAGLGREASLSLGLSHSQVMAFGLVTVSLVTAMVVVTVGILPFIGLVVPNLVSRIMGDNLRQSLPVVAALGAGLVLTADILGRVIRYPYEIPAGTVFGVIGAILFLWILLGRRSHA